MSQQIEKNMAKRVYIVENAASRCYTPILRHLVEGMDVQVLTLDDSADNRMESIMACIRECDAVLISGAPDADMAVAVGAAYAMERPVLHLCNRDDLTSSNVAAAVATFIFDTGDVVAKLQDMLQPEM